MKDRVPTKPGRVLITPEGGGAPYYATMTRADEPSEVGTALNKQNLLKDNTAVMYSQDPATSTVDTILAQNLNEAYRFKIAENQSVTAKQLVTITSDGISPNGTTATSLTLPFNVYRVVAIDGLRYLLIGSSLCVMSYNISTRTATYGTAITNPVTGAESSITDIGADGIFMIGNKRTLAAFQISGTTITQLATRNPAYSDFFYDYALIPISSKIMVRWVKNRDSVGENNYTSYTFNGINTITEGTPVVLGNYDLVNYNTQGLYVQRDATSGFIIVSPNGDTSVKYYVPISVSSGTTFLGTRTQIAFNFTPVCWAIPMGYGTAIFYPYGSSYIVCNAVSSTLCNFTQTSATPPDSESGSRTNKTTPGMIGFMYGSRLMEYAVSGSAVSLVTDKTIGSFSGSNFIFVYQLLSGRYIAFSSTVANDFYLTDLSGSLILGVARESGAAGQSILVQVGQRILDIFSGLAVGQKYYSAPNGGITTATGGTYIGTAVSATALLFMGAVNKSGGY